MIREYARHVAQLSSCMNFKDDVKSLFHGAGY